MELPLYKVYDNKGFIFSARTSINEHEFIKEMLCRFPDRYLFKIFKNGEVIFKK